ncbi:MAG: TldD/PmbA family protein [Candidatus Lokiarchaeota archaeon]|nr:TldD/PmbA family protein [Candidatus Lokiarchaeota archaeon]
MKSYSNEEISLIFEDIAKDYNRENQYFDILYDSTSLLRIKKSRSEEIISNNEQSGIVGRTYIGKWKEVAINNFSDLESLKHKIPKISEQDSILKRLDGWELKKKINPQIDPQTITIEEKTQKIRKIYEFLKNYDDKIINPIIGYSEVLNSRIFINNEGSNLIQVIPRTRLFIQPIAKEGNKIDFDYYSIGGEIGFEIFDKLEDQLEKIAQNSLNMLNAESPPSGKYPIILDPDMTGLIAHESFGHGLEADQILRERSYLKNLLDKKVASELCNINDTPNISSELGSSFFDDEGIKTEKNILVENGILRDFIHNRITASILDSEPKGNGRRESYAHPLYVRMSNTYFEPGDYSLEEMISEIKNGVLLCRGYFGMEDPLGGGLQVTSKKGFLIKNGEETKLLKAITLSGSVLDLLNSIDAISKDKLKLKPGSCGKGYEDFVPVTSGGSYTRTKEALISPG